MDGAVAYDEGKLVLHKVVHQVGDALKLMISRFYLCGDMILIVNTPPPNTYLLPFSLSSFHPLTFPCLSISKRCCGVPLAIPVRTYCPGRLALSRIKNCPSPSSRASASTRLTAPWKYGCVLRAEWCDGSDWRRGAEERVSPHEYIYTTVHTLHHPHLPIFSRGSFFTFPLSLLRLI